MNEVQVLDWLQKNRYKQPELSLFVFGIASMGLCFVLYTVFILVFLKHPSEGGGEVGGSGGDKVAGEKAPAGGE